MHPNPPPSTEHTLLPASKHVENISFFSVYNYSRSSFLIYLVNTINFNTEIPSHYSSIYSLLKKEVGVDSVKRCFSRQNDSL